MHTYVGTICVKGNNLTIRIRKAF